MREEEEDMKLDRGGREESDGDGGVLLIVSHISRVVPQTDLHTNPQGARGSVCLSVEPRRVGGLSITHRLPVPHLFLS